MLPSPGIGDNIPADAVDANELVPVAGGRDHDVELLEELGVLLNWLTRVSANLDLIIDIYTLHWVNKQLAKV